jgi:aspartate carbamoyltransferase catalytic subunit
MKRDETSTRTKHSFGETTRRHLGRMTRLPTVMPSKRDGWLH